MPNLEYILSAFSAAPRLAGQAMMGVWFRRPVQQPPTPGTFADDRRKLRADVERVGADMRLVMDRYAREHNIEPRV
jgi:hypothetical protein